jgi:Response regulator containing a CheY-like receiver domain and an HTH DNA-binding domain
MARNPSRRTAIVADRRPLERSLARFLLEERGLFVVGEAATMADVLLQVQQHRPDLVVLHEKLAEDHDPSVIAQIRRVSPPTSIVLLAASRASLAPELLLLADTVVEDGPGFTELGAAIVGGVVRDGGGSHRRVGSHPRTEPIRQAGPFSDRQAMGRSSPRDRRCVDHRSRLHLRPRRNAIDPAATGTGAHRCGLGIARRYRRGRGCGGERSDRGVGASSLDRAGTRR